MSALRHGAVAAGTVLRPPMTMPVGVVVARGERGGRLGGADEERVQALGLAAVGQHRPEVVARGGGARDVLRQLAGQAPPR